MTLMCIYDSIWVPKGIVKLSFEILLTTDINSRAYYETCHVVRIVVFHLKPSKFQKGAFWVSRKGEKTFFQENWVPLFGTVFPHLGNRVPLSENRVSHSGNWVTHSENRQWPSCEFLTDWGQKLQFCQHSESYNMPQTWFRHSENLAVLSL